MTTFGGDVLTMLEFAKRTNPDGGVADMANVLTQECPMFRDAPNLPSNMPTSHRTTLVTGLPPGNRRRLNRGTPASRGTTLQIQDGMTMYDSWVVIDAKELEIFGNAEAHRDAEVALHTEGLAQLVEGDIVYGSEADSDLEYNGFFIRPYLSSLASDQVLDAGGSGSDNASILVVGWAPNKVHLVHPKNSPSMGIRNKDWGVQPVMEGTTDIAASTMVAARNHLEVENGLVVKDQRYVVRVANIDMSELLSVTGDQELTDYQTEVLFVLTRATHRLHSRSACKPVIYMPRSVYEGFDLHLVARTSSNVFEYKQFGDEMLNSFRGIPIRVSDQMLYNETAVT